MREVRRKAANLLTETLTATVRIILITLIRSVTSQLSQTTTTSIFTHKHTASRQTYSSMLTKSI